jgi:hypothetical protein
MSADPKLIEAFALISAAVDAAYERGRKDAIDAMLRAASGALHDARPDALRDSIVLPSLAPDGPPNDWEDRKRAPRGSAERVIRRAILASAGNGASMPDIIAARQGELEMMLVDSSLRGELRRGEKTGKYQEIAGRWFLID